MTLKKEKKSNHVCVQMKYTLDDPLVSAKPRPRPHHLTLGWSLQQESLQTGSSLAPCHLAALHGWMLL